MISSLLRSWSVRLRFPDFEDMANMELSADQVEEYRNAFDLFDKNGDGRISKKELTNIMKSLGQKPSKKTVEQMMRDVDLDRNGYIDFGEFCRYMADNFDQERQHKEETIDAFKAKSFNFYTSYVYDKNGDGFIDAEELMQVMNNVGLEITNAEAESMIRAADTNGDGRVDLTEFMKFMRNIDPQAEQDLCQRGGFSSSIKRKN